MFLDRDVRGESDNWMGIEVAKGNDEILDSPDYDYCRLEQRVIAHEVYDMSEVQKAAWLKKVKGRPSCGFTFTSGIAMYVCGSEVDVGHHTAKVYCRPCTREHSEVSK